MLERFARGSRCRKMNCASGNTSSRNGTRSAFFGVFSSRRTVAPDAGGCPSRSWILPREALAQLRDDRGGRIPARQAIRVHDAAPGSQRGDALDELVALAADGVDARRLGERLEQQRAAGARRAQDDDRPLQHGRLVRFRHRCRRSGGAGGDAASSGSSAIVTVSMRGTSTVGRSICGNSTVGRLLSVGSSPAEARRRHVPATTSARGVELGRFRREPPAPPSSMREQACVEHGLRAVAGARDAHRRQLPRSAGACAGEQLSYRPRPSRRIAVQGPERAPVVAELDHRVGRTGRPPRPIPAARRPARDRRAGRPRAARLPRAASAGRR